MARGDIRNKISNLMMDVDDVIKDESYIEYNEVINIVDGIEDRINDIRNRLEPFTNLTEIKEIYDLITELSKDLY